jgi:hypothetical protein
MGQSMGPVESNLMARLHNMTNQDFFFCGGRGSNYSLAYIIHCPYQLKI